MKQGQNAYSVKKGFEIFFKKLKNPDYVLQQFINQKTLSGKINQAVKIATTDFIELKNENYRLEDENRQLQLRIDEVAEIFKTEKELQYKKSNFKNVKK